MPKKTVKKTTKTAKKPAAVKKVEKTVATKKTAKATKKAVGKRGRPKGVRNYGCEMTPLRVPAHLKDEIHALVQKKLKAEAKKKSSES